jgi:alkanesulfonate monooxygenase SsuD/methylene tetrahydromethanopterin reductase-like flavin-dependent oxidoreductase (luciferase family)
VAGHPSGRRAADADAIAPGWLRDGVQLPFASLAESAAQFERVRKACVEMARDPGSVIMSNALVVCCGATDAEVNRRAEAIGRDPAELRQNGLAGSPDEIVDKIGRYGEVGAKRIYLQVLDLRDLEHLDLIASEVMPRV